MKRNLSASRRRNQVVILPLNRFEQVCNFFRAKFCKYGNSAYLCSAFHSETGDQVADNPSAGIFVPIRFRIVPSRVER